MADDQNRQRLHQMMANTRSAMLVTRTIDGELRARPMALADVREGDEELWFATNVDSGKVREMLADPHVLVTVESTSKYVSISGHAEVTQDRAAIERLWSESWKPWFPKGKDDPSLSLIRVRPVYGEYWDQSAPHRVRYLLELVRAYVTGTEAKPVPGQHGHARLS